MGLFGGVHCVAMCGGVVGVLCSAAPRQHRYPIAYNAGRLGAYVTLGAMFAALGSGAVGAFPLEAIRFTLRAFAAVLMLGIGLHLAGLPSIVKPVESIGAPVWRRVEPLAKRFLPLRSPFHALVVGSLWGLMPCGLLYAALALATTADSALEGAMTMGAFGLGTLPVMLSLGAVATRIKKWLARLWVRRFAGAVVLAFGLYSSVGLAQQTGVAQSLGLGGHRHCCPRPAR
jgi:hypothetical protein